jgi:hypothetical protein
MSRKETNLQSEEIWRESSRADDRVFTGTWNNDFADQQLGIVGPNM